MKKSSTAETSKNQKSKGSVAAPSVTQQSAVKPIAVKPIKDKLATNVPAKTLPVQANAPGNPIPAATADVPMHAAQGNDDIMSQPQASQIVKKKS